MAEKTSGGWADNIGKLIDGAANVYMKKYENPWGSNGLPGNGIPYPGNPNANTGGYYPTDDAGAGGSFSIDRNALMMGAALLAVLGVALVVAR